LLVRWVLLAVGLLWPVVTFAGGLGFSPLIGLAALACLPAGLKGWSPRVYMFFLFAGLEFAVASALWSNQDGGLLGVDDRSGSPKIDVDALRVGFTLLWAGFLIQAARSLTQEHAREVLRMAAIGFFLQFAIVVVLTVLETQAIELFGGMMSSPAEGVQNISRNQIILSTATPLLAVLLLRVLPERQGMVAAIGVMAVTVGTLLAREVDGAVLAIFAGCVAGGVILVAPRWGFRILGAAVALLLALTPVLFRALSAGADASAATTSAEWRLAIWKRVIRVVEENPVTGAGVGALRQISETIPPGTGAFAGERLVPNHPHNMLLQVWAEMGAIGAAFFACAILAAALRMPEPRKLGAVGPLAAALTAQVLMISLVSFDLWNDWWWAVCGLMVTFLVVLRRADGPTPVPVLASWSRTPGAAASPSQG
jgi:O-antigen ligase